MTFVTLAASTINIGGLPVPSSILLLGVILVVLAVLGGAAAIIVSKVRNKNNPQPSAFEQLVAAQMAEEGLRAEETAVAEKAEVKEDKVEEAIEKVPAAETSDEHELVEDEPEVETVADVVEPVAEVEELPQKTQEEVQEVQPEEELVPAQAGLIAEDEEEEIAVEKPLVKNDEAPIAFTEEEEADIPDLIATPQEGAQAAPNVVETTPDTTEEEDEIVLAAVDTADEANGDETLLSSMTDFDKDYGDFDFGGDFDEWEDEPDEPEDAEEVDILGELDVDDEEYSAADTEEVVSVGGVIIGSKYRRSFRSKLIQGSAQNKQYYSIVKNELLSYEKGRCKESWSGEAYMWGRRTYARMSIAGKTLCVFLALDPKAYADVYGKLRFRDVSGVRKYANTPMMMRVKSDLSLRRTLRLITHVALANDLHKIASFAAVDYKSGLSAKSDEELLTLNLIKLNPKYVQQVSTAAALEAQEADVKLRPAFDVTPVKKEQVGNLTEKDLEELSEKKERKETGKKQFASETGKFVIAAEGDTWHFWYYAPNGKLLCVGEGCNSKELAYKSVTAYREIIGSSEAVVNTVDDKYFYTVRAHGRVFSSVMYDTQSACLDGLRVAKETADEAVIEFAIQ